MGGILFDTSVYISALRRGDATPFTTRRTTRAEATSTNPLWLSAVVLEELYAGAQDRRMKKLCAGIERSFNKAGRVLTPIGSDWTACGQILCQIGQKYGYGQIGCSRMTNDALIAISAARNGLTIFTTNATDFRRIAEFRWFDWVEV